MTETNTPSCGWKMRCLSVKRFPGYEEVAVEDVQLSGEPAARLTFRTTADYPDLLGLYTPGRVYYLVLDSEPLE